MSAKPEIFSFGSLQKPTSALEDDLVSFSVSDKE